MSAPTRHVLQGPDARLSYLDYGGGGPALVALHGHLNDASFVGPLVDTIGGDFRLLSLDQRGHGESDHASSYANDRYVDDAAAFLDHLGLEQAVILGHSLGGVVGFRLAARSPERVSAMIISDIGAVIGDDIAFITEWPRRTATREELVVALGDFGPAHAYSMRQYADGWGLPFDADQMVISQQELNGDHWADWTATTMPTLLLRGRQSPVLSRKQAEEMVRRRPGTSLVELNAGHSLHFDDSDAYAAAIAGFLTPKESRVVADG